MPRFHALLSLRFALALMIPMLVVAGVHGFLEYRHSRDAERADAARFGAVILDANFDKITEALTVRNTPRPSSVLSDRVRANLDVSSLELVDTLGNLQRTLTFGGSDCLSDGPDAGSSHEHVVVSRTTRGASGERIGEVRMVICLDDELAAFSSQHFRFLVVLVTLLAAAIPAIVWIQRWYVGFMNSLVAAMNRISRGRGSARARGELGPLGSAFDRMAERVASQGQEVMQMRDTAVKAAESARRATDAKSRFLAHMSHEIRTPMTAILGYTELIIDPSTGADERQQHAETIRRNGEHLLSIINDILDVSKVEAGRMAVERVVCSPFDVVREVMTLLRDRANQKGVHLTCEYPEPIPDRIRTDPVRLQQILVNLVGNALKFTERGSVQLVTRPLTSPDGKEHLEFQIIDTGIGMSREAVRKLFKPFTQAETAITRNYGGTGLGLTISKQLSELLGGAISVESEQGKGSTFTVIIPTGTVRGSQRRTESVALATQDPAGGRFTTDAYPQYRGRVLLAEDSPDVRGLVTQLLLKTGVELAVVENGALALQAGLASLQQGRSYDLILMDMHMPKMNGDVVVQELREAGYSGKIVALTAHATGEALDSIMKAGCDAHFLKPFKREKLLRFLGDYLEPAEQVQAKQVPAEQVQAEQVPAEQVPAEQVPAEQAPAAGPAIAEAMELDEVTDVQVLDVEPLLSDYADDPDMAGFIAEFARMLPNQVRDLEVAISRGDMEAAAHVAHQLKGAAGTVGFPVISDHARLLEEAMEQQRPPAEVAAVCAVLVRLCRRAAGGVRV